MDLRIKYKYLDETLFTSQKIDKGIINSNIRRTIATYTSSENISFLENVDSSKSVDKLHRPIKVLGLSNI